MLIRVESTIFAWAHPTSNPGRSARSESESGTGHFRLYLFAGHGPRVRFEKKCESDIIVTPILSAAIARSPRALRDPADHRRGVVRYHIYFRGDRVGAPHGRCVRSAWGSGFCRPYSVPFFPRSTGTNQSQRFITASWKTTISESGVQQIEKASTTTGGSSRTAPPILWQVRLSNISTK